MELKNVNSNVVASNLNNVIFYILKIVKIGIKNEHYMLFFLKDIMIAKKIKFLILFTSPINIE
jgi:hypothetical protein